MKPGDREFKIYKRTNGSLKTELLEKLKEITKELENLTLKRTYNRI